jgi:polygalacturonase
MNGKTNAVYAETSEGLMVSYDHASTFKKISNEVNLGDFFLSSTDSILMFSARGTSGLFRSEDGGRTWSKLAVELKGPTRFAEARDGSLWMSDPATGTVRSLSKGNEWQEVWNTFGAISYDPWNEHSVYMATRGGIWWVHPKEVQRKEIPYHYNAVDGKGRVVNFQNTVFAKYSNSQYKLTKDIQLKGKVHDLVMMPRGLKNVTIDGQNHSVIMTGGNAIFGDDLENLTIENFTFIQNSGDAAPALYLGNCRNLTIKNCQFKVAADFVAGRNGAAPAIETKGIFTNNVVIENCSFNTPGRSPVIFGNGKHIIRHCKFEGNRATNILLVEGEDSVIEDNDVKSDTVKIN